MTVVVNIPLVDTTAEFGVVRKLVDVVRVVDAAGSIFTREVGTTGDFVRRVG